ncbi:MAG: sugar nucleotide-binding protein, partial [Beijerinckiaceae bacterium]
FDAAAGRGRPAPRLVAISTADYPTPARRPLNSRLDTTRVEHALGIRLRPWEEAIDEIVARAVP